MHKSDGLSTSIKKSSIARWFTGCYIDYEDKCFNDKLFGSLTPPETFEEKKTRCFPVPMDFRKKEPLKTNGASSKLGFTVLLDPMLHDQINGKKKILVPSYEVTLNQPISSSWARCRGDR